MTVCVCKLLFPLLCHTDTGLHLCCLRDTVDPYDTPPHTHTHTHSHMDNLPLLLTYSTHNTAPPALLSKGTGCHTDQWWHDGYWLCAHAWHNDQFCVHVSTDTANGGTHWHTQCQYCMCEGAMRLIWGQWVSLVGMESRTERDRGQDQGTARD